MSAPPIYHRDISLTEFRLLAQTFELVRGGHIKPIHPIKTFGFDNVAGSFAYMRSGRHIGKIVITNGENKNIEVPVRPAERELVLRKDASYLIVGGLKGLCGSLAIYLAQKGAKSLIVMSRSGGGDERSQSIVRNCEALGCQIIEAKADVSEFRDVQRVFRDAPMRIAGVIQGAMVLRVSTAIQRTSYMTY